MARVFEQKTLEILAKFSGVPVINGLSNDHHPVQILSDLLTIKEKTGKLAGLTLAYLGDGNNNVTHSLLLGCAMAGIHIRVACPSAMLPNKAIFNEALLIARKSQTEMTITQEPAEAVKNADIVYTDSWMSYHINPQEKDSRLRALMPYQVNQKTVQAAKKDYLFMNCLPAMREYEQTAEIIDGKHSIVFDQAENRLHMQKALLLWLLSDASKTAQSKNRKQEK